MRKSLLAAALLAATWFVPSYTFAAPCAGAAPFSDVLATDVFCSFIDWLKNRAITLGCAANTYCPKDPVPRDQMAAFMNRLADAIAPQPIVVDENPGPLDLSLLGIANVACKTIVPPVNYPRTFVVSSLLAVLMSSGTGAVHPVYVYTTDGDTTNWSALSSYAPIVSPDATHWATATQTQAFNIPAGATSKVALWVSSADPNAAKQVSQSYCHMQVDARSRTGTSPPYDAAQ